MTLEHLIPKGIPRLENGNLRRSKLALLLIGVCLAVIGLAALTVEFYRTFTGLQPDIRWNYIRLAGVPLFLGAVLVYTLNPLAVLRTAVEVIDAAAPIINSRIPGGQRRTDPPLGAEPLNADEAELIAHVQNVHEAARASRAAARAAREAVRESRRKPDA